MQSINKIHINSSTEMSLNDRFTIMQRSGPTHPTASNETGRRIRMRSSSRPAGRPPALNRTTTSTQNRRLLEQLDKKHKMRAALRLKRRSVRTNLTPRQTMTNRARNRVGLKRAAQNTLNRGRFRRSNSLSNVRTMQADLMATGLTRTNSTASIVDRLGNGGRRRKLNRTNMSNARGRSNSRQRLELRTRSNSRASQRQTNSQASQRQTNSQTNLRRTDSRQSIRTMKRSNSRQRNAQQPPQQLALRQQRANSRRRLNQTAAGRRLSTSNLPNRRMSTNGRLQQQQQQPLTNRIGNRRRASTNSRINNNVNRRQRGGGAVLNGRILKQKNVNLRGFGVRGRGTVNNNQRAIQNRGRSRSRVAQQQTNARSRSASRGRANRQGNGNNNKNFQNRSNGQNANGGRPQGRSRSRARRRSTGAPGKAGNQLSVKTKEQLDRELDQYMVNTKSHNDLDSLIGHI